MCLSIPKIAEYGGLGFRVELNKTGSCLLFDVVGVLPVPCGQAWFCAESGS